VDGSASPAAASAAVPPATDPRRRRRRAFTVAVVVAIVVLAVAAVLLYLETTGPMIQVNAILLDAPDNACGLNDEHVAYHGYSSSGGSPTTFAFQMPNLNDSSCVVVSLTTNTPGFAVSGLKLPLTIPARSEISLTLSIAPPARSYSGDLNLVAG
jgi:hypothetical protein